MSEDIVQLAHKRSQGLSDILEALDTASIIAEAYELNNVGLRIHDAKSYARLEYRKNLSVAGRMLAADDIVKFRTDYIVNEDKAPITNLNFYGDTAIFTRNGNNWRMDFKPEGFERLTLNIL